MIKRFFRIPSLLFLLTASLVCPSCKVVEFTSIGEQYPAGPPLDIGNGVKVSSTGTVHMNMMGLRKADFMAPGVRIEGEELLVYIDPLEVKDSIPADYIFITHSHADHFSREDIRRISGDETVIVGPRPVTRKLKDRMCQTVRPGMSVELGEISFEVVPAYNLKRGFFHIPLHPYSDNYAGYILAIDGMRIYHAGDTDLIPEMESYIGLDLALVPIGEGNTAMNPETAARAVNLMRPHFAIPLHYELGKGREARFVKKVNNPTRVELFY